MGQEDGFEELINVAKSSQADHHPMPPNNYEITAEDVELHNKNVVHPPKFTIKAISHYLMSRPKTLFISRQEWNDINWSDVVQTLFAVAL